MVKNLFLFKTLFVLLLVVSLLFDSFEAVIILSFLLFILLLSSSKTFISINFLNNLSPLIGILLIAILGAFFRKSDFIFILKDFLYILKPVLFLLIGYLISKKINDRNTFFKIIIFTATGFAVYHIFQFLIYISQMSSFSMNNMRSAIGTDNFLELFALAIIISKTQHEGLTIKYLRLITIVLAISFLLYFSRTMFALIIIVSLAFLGYLRISKKGLRYIFLGLISLALFYTYLFSVNIPRDSNSTLDNFLYKLKLAPAEIFISQESFDISNHAQLWDHWRAYEASKAISQLNEQGIVAWSLGLGAGSLVDLDFYAPLSDDPKGMRYISILHNGYVFVLYKTGVLGVMFYLLFILGNYLAYKKSKFRNSPLANMIFGIVLFYISTSLVINGIYNLSDITTLLLGGILFLIQRNQ
ncbi:hypothetical protein SAMN03097699_2675 [Flavobacteriaceae bacterium MAR_2010_188]|nr:hypothetical protein SAMN03097699_2675 [Flavobacteriaceae bacterium MAR_2010_188]